MSEYIVSARKYRPDSFESLIGQDNIARTLKNSILRGQLAHAYLFCGPRGVGKTSTARIFAKAINCSNPSEDMEPCGQCESCQSFAEGRSYCIHELDAASNNGVEHIKTLLEQVVIPPQVGRYSVYIIDEVHMLSSAAFNAFLKTLEEPPAHAIFILCTTEKHKIIPTILSRCQTFDFNRISVSDIIKNLTQIAQAEGINIDQKSMHVIARKADGAMRDALTLFDQTVAFCGSNVTYQAVLSNLNVLDYEYGFKLVDSALSGDYGSALLLFDDVLRKGFNAQYFVSSVSEHLRDLLVSRTAGLDSLLDFPESLRQAYADQAARCSVKFLYDALAVTSACEAGYRAAANQRLHIEFALMKLCFLVSQASAVASPVSAVLDGPKKAISTQPDTAPVQSVVLEQPVVSQASPVLDSPKKAVSDQAAPAPVQSVVPEQPVVAEPVRVEEIKPVQAAPVQAGKIGGISMKAMLAASQSEQQQAAQAAESAAYGVVPEDEQLVQAWKQLADSTADRPRLCSALQSAHLAIALDADGSKVLTFSVANESQKSWIRDNMLRQLESQLRDILATSRVKLDIDVVFHADELKPHLPIDKAKALMGENPQVGAIVMELGLDIK